MINMLMYLVINKLVCFEIIGRKMFNSMLMAFDLHIYSQSQRYKIVMG